MKYFLNILFNSGVVVCLYYFTNIASTVLIILSIVSIVVGLCATFTSLENKANTEIMNNISKISRHGIYYAVFDYIVNIVFIIFILFIIHNHTLLGFYLLDTMMCIAVDSTYLQYKDKK